MKQTMDRTSSYFQCTERERAAFEGGIKLAALFHQYVGCPMNETNVSSMERAMKEGLLAQMFVTDAVVTIDRQMLKEHLSNLGYCSLNEKMIDARVKVQVGGTFLTARLHYVPELKYPLMFIERIEEK